MKALLAFLLVCAAVPLFAEVQVIPLTAPDTYVYVQNANPSPQKVTIAFTSVKHTVDVGGYTTAQIRSTERGYVLVTSQFPVLTWTQIDSAVIAGVYLNTQHRTFTARPNTGIAIANPWNERTRITFWRYAAATGQPVDYKNAVIEPGNNLTGFLDDILGKSDGMQIAVLAERRVAVAVAACTVTCITLPVDATGASR